MNCPNCGEGKIKAIPTFQIIASSRNTEEVGKVELVSIGQCEGCGEQVYANPVSPPLTGEDLFKMYKKPLFCDCDTCMGGECHLTNRCNPYHHPPCPSGKCPFCGEWK